MSRFRRPGRPASGRLCRSARRALHLAPGPCAPEGLSRPRLVFFRAPSTCLSYRHVSALLAVPPATLACRAAVPARLHRAALVGRLYRAVGAGGGPHAGVGGQPVAGPPASTHPPPHASKQPVAMGIRQQLASAPVVGIGGSRAPGSASRPGTPASASPHSAGTPVVTGCASGIDAAVRQGRPSVRVIRAASARPYALVRRSVQCVQAVARAGGVWVSFPGRSCPPGVRPASSAAACFCGGGSGSWASLALAAGRGCPCLVFLPVGIHPPPAFGLRALGRGWFWRGGNGQQRLL